MHIYTTRVAFIQYTQDAPFLSCAQTHTHTHAQTTSTHKQQAHPHTQNEQRIKDCTPWEKGLWETR